MMITGLISLSMLGFIGALAYLLKAKPAQERTAQKLVLFFGYSACFYLLVQVLLPVGGGV